MQRCLFGPPKVPHSAFEGPLPLLRIRFSPVRKPNMTTDLTKKKGFCPHLRDQRIGLWSVWHPVLSRTQPPSLLKLFHMWSHGHLMIQMALASPASTSGFQLAGRQERNGKDTLPQCSGSYTHHFCLKPPSQNVVTKEAGKCSSYSG